MINVQKILKFINIIKKERIILWRKKVCVIVLSVICVTSLVLYGCGENTQQSSETESEEGLNIITTISIIADFVENIIGDRSSVTYLVPIGEEPEEYEPVPSDFRKIADADIVFANGVNLEEWLEKIMRNVGDTEVVYVTKGAPTLTLVDTDIEDPHLWLDVRYVIDYYVKNIVDTLITIDPEGESIYRQNSKAYTDELIALEEWIVKKLSEVPQENRIIIISENACKYLGDAYGFEAEGIWELNAHEEGTPQQISRIVDLVKERKIPAVFVETTVDERYMQMISNETGVAIAGTLYTDAVGVKGSGADTYIKMMRHNIKVIVSGLGE